MLPQTVTAAGSFTRTVWRTEPSSLSQRAQPSSTSSADTSVTWGISRKAAVAGPVWAVSPSTAWRPKMRRSKPPIFSAAFDRTYEVASVSAPPKARSESRYASSQPMASAFLSASSACGGPIVTAATVPPCVSRSCSAASTALASRGLSMLLTPSRQRFPVLGSSLTSSVSGTCFTNTIIFMLTSRPSSRR